MHDGNRRWWQYCASKYWPYFWNKDVHVVEFGSFNVCGSIRDHFVKPKKYLGVDWRKGPCVDVVGLAHEVHLGEFDVVASASMLEHDPHWKNSLPNMVDHMKPTGIMILSWGNIDNDAHCLDTATDGKFHPLPSLQVLNCLNQLLHVHEFRYENYVGGVPDGSCLVAFKSMEEAMKYDSGFDKLRDHDK